MPGLGKMILTDTHIGKDVPDELAFPALLKRLLANSHRTESGCLEWTGWRGATGYGFTSFRGRQRPTHRLMYMVTEGPIPEGLQILHSCDNPPCMEPDHISPGTGKKNMQESVERGRHHEAVKTHCDHGHELVGDNRYVTPKGNIECRTCRQIARTRYGKKQKRHFSGGTERHCALCDKPLQSDYQHATCEDCVNAGKLL